MLLHRLSLLGSIGISSPCARQGRWAFLVHSIRQILSGTVCMEEESEGFLA